MAQIASYLPPNPLRPWAFGGKDAEGLREGIRSKAFSAMSNFALLFITLAASAQMSCRTMKQTETTSSGSEIEEWVLQSDRGNFIIVRPEGSVHLTVPDGWRITRQEGMNGEYPTYSLAPVKADDILLFIKVDLRTAHKRGLTEEESHDSRLGHIHSNFPNAYRRQSGKVTLHDGRSVALEAYFDGDVPELVGFVFDHGYVTTFSLKAESSDEIAKNRASFEDLVRSYRFK